jgi:hypothetical protein
MSYLQLKEVIFGLRTRNEARQEGSDKNRARCRKNKFQAGFGGFFFSSFPTQR